MPLGPLVILVNVWIGSPLVYLAASVRSRAAYEAAAIDGPTGGSAVGRDAAMMRKYRHHRAVLADLTFANFDIVRILTAGGSIDRTHVFATWSFGWASTTIFRSVPQSRCSGTTSRKAAIFILRDINDGKRSAMVAAAVNLQCRDGATALRQGRDRRWALRWRISSWRCLRSSSSRRRSTW